MLEIWKPVVGYEHYYHVSDQGRVRRIARASGTQVGKILKSTLSNGYPTVVLCKNGEGGKTFTVHSLVWQAFQGFLNGLEINHKDSNRSNARLSNLESVTSQQNNQHARAYLVKMRGLDKANFTAKLTEDNVRFIRANYVPRTFTLITLAKMFGVTKGCIHWVIRGCSWKEVK